MGSCCSSQSSQPSSGPPNRPVQKQGQGQGHAPTAPQPSSMAYTYPSTGHHRPIQASYFYPHPQSAPSIYGPGPVQRTQIRRDSDVSELSSSSLDAEVARAPVSPMEPKFPQIKPVAKSKVQVVNASTSGTIQDSVGSWNYLDEEEAKDREKGNWFI